MSGVRHFLSRGKRFDFWASATHQFRVRAYAGRTEGAVSILGKWLPRRQGMEFRTTGKQLYRDACHLGRRP
jgi:hypothetical protein